MARPKNVVALMGKTVVSVSPSKLKAYLKSLKDGTPVELEGAKVVGTVDLSLDSVTSENAESTYTTLFQEPMVAPDTAVAAPEKPAAPTPDLTIF